MDIVIRGFKSKKSMIAFLEWYYFQGEEEFNRPDASLSENTSVYMKEEYEQGNDKWEGDSLIIEVEEKSSD